MGVCLCSHQEGKTEVGLVLSQAAAETLGRLCDAFHPREVGGYLLGSREISLVVSDVLGCPNYSQTPDSQFQFGDAGKYFADVFGKSVGKELLGHFHSHPNGSIPSAPDVEACGRGLWLWVCHHAHGEHTFFAADNFLNLEVTIQANPQESRQPFISVGRLNLGDVWLNQWGKLDGDNKILRLLELDEKARRAYLAVLQLPKDKWQNRVSVFKVGEFLNVSTRTAREWLKECQNKGLVKRGYGSRGRFDSVELV